MLGDVLDVDHRDPYPGARMGLIALYITTTISDHRSNLDGAYRVRCHVRLYPEI